MSRYRAWAHCPLCPPDKWVESDTMVYMGDQGIMVKGHIAFYVCRDHAAAIVKKVKKKKGRR